MGGFHPKVTVNRALYLLDRKSIHTDRGLKRVCKHGGWACDFHQFEPDEAAAFVCQQTLGIGNFIWYILHFGCSKAEYAYFPKFNCILGDEGHWIVRFWT